ncbi:unnamed protein product, partial [Heligmosomoides polygyrus]|uniref:DUF5110 domain-containing protein n=1 Tax=Heligmosomoides polygyrus TaxID=6339 RepID=A0A183FCS4_HELPZ
MQAVQVRCEGDLEEVAERVIWPLKRGIEPGVYAIKGQRTEVPVFNDSDEPVLLKEGENVGYWGTDKWHDRWEDINPFLMETKESPKGNERVDKLCELLERNAEGGALEPKVRGLVERYAQAFAVADNELSQTDLVEMKIET